MNFSSNLVFHSRGEASQGVCMTVCRSRNLGDLVVEVLEQKLCLRKICCHGAVLSIKVVGNLVDHQLGVTENINLFNPEVFGQT
ncbi:hypothetical protein PS1_005244 [Malus domestica]